MARIVNGRINRPTSPVWDTSDYLARRLAAVFLVLLLYNSVWTTTLGFHPFSWILPSAPGAYFLDAFLGPIIVFGGFVFQWTIASSSMAVTIIYGDAGFMYRRQDYWHFLGAELGGIALVWMAGEQAPVARLVVVLIFAGLWTIGWQVTPEGFKSELKELAKGFLIIELFHQARSMPRRR
ncbi:hypothetical protein K402DRAFT_392233 [Aulographum hederae CBS 113979]|uniref:Uncharacterized protein n=1 Tax=Aulographum hederae CBS 113979 TaxID=1176131 RepID=A0A6G1H4G0_9PEZI|nr:hypothetical protein K402DRAFT_392233 [Aulographum hederae CBS 113979]